MAHQLNSTFLQHSSKESLVGGGFRAGGERVEGFEREGRGWRVLSGWGEGGGFGGRRGGLVGGV